jgi:hypothetical protein
MTPFFITNTNAIIPIMNQNQQNTILLPLLGVIYNTICLFLLPIIYLIARVMLYICNSMITIINKNSVITILLATFIIKCAIEIEKIERIFNEICRRVRERFI